MADIYPVAEGDLYGDWIADGTTENGETLFGDIADVFKTGISAWVDLERADQANDLRRYELQLRQDTATGTVAQDGVTNSPGLFNNLDPAKLLIGAGIVLGTVVVINKVL